MSNILGNGIPQLTGTGTPGTSTVVFNYGTIAEMNLSEKIYQMNESIINGIRTHDYKGRHATVVVRVKLDNYVSNKMGYPALPTAKAFFSSLCTYEHQDVYFHLSTNGPRFKDTSNNDITLHVVNVDLEFEVMEGLIGDVAVIVFKTNKPFDLSKLILPVIP